MFARGEGAESWVPPVDNVLEVTEAMEQERFRYADVETGLRIGYIERGDPKSALPLVVFVHGFPDTLWTWEAAMTTLATKVGFFLCVCASLPLCL